MLDALESASRVASMDNWPPYDIVKVGEDDYCISMAVSGFTQDDLNHHARAEPADGCGPEVGR